MKPWLLILVPGVLKISLAGANHSVPTTALTPCIIIVHVIIVAPKKTSTPAGIPWHREWHHSANFTLLSGMVHTYVGKMPQLYSMHSVGYMYII